MSSKKKNAPIKATQESDVEMEEEKTTTEETTKKKKNPAASTTTSTTASPTADSGSGSESEVELPTLPHLTCAVCNGSDRGDFVPHPIMKIATCPPCAKRINAVEFTVDEQGLHDWCSVCADGGEMFLCDTCGRAICHEDCEELVGEDYLDECQASDKWQCWVCDPKPIAQLQADTAKYLSIPHALRRLAARAELEREAEKNRMKKRQKQKDEGKRSKSIKSKSPEETEDEEEEKGEETKSTKRGRPSRKRDTIDLRSSVDEEEEDEEDEEDDQPKKKGRARPKTKKRKRSDDENEFIDDEAASDGDDDEDQSGSDDSGVAPSTKRHKRSSSSKQKRKKSTKERNSLQERKKIRELIDDSKLKRTTKEALQQEEARLERIRLRNEAAAGVSSSTVIAADEDEEMEEDDDHDIPADLLKPTAVCINPNHGPKEDAWYIPAEIASLMKPHQVAGVRFIWDVVVESVAHLRSQRPEQGLGCLLAHFCGLGKTVQIISFLYCYLNGQLGSHALIVAPVNTLQNWVAEFSKWLTKSHELDVWCLDSCLPQRGKNVQVVRMECLKDWKRTGGVMIIGYEAFRAIYTCNSKHLRKTQNADCKDLLLHTADIIVADEGHRLRNAQSSLAAALKAVRTRRRVVLTGTPLQNNLSEYYAMLEFVRPHFLGTAAEFNNRFTAPIRNGQCLDSTPEDVKLMKSRVHVLHKKLEPLVHRVEYSMLDKGGKYSSLNVDQVDNSDSIVPAPHDPTSISTINTLPTKHEYVVFVRLSPFQRQLYLRFIQTHRMTLFKAYHSLMKIWNHPSCLESTTAVLDADSDLDDDDEMDGRKRKRKSASTQLPHPEILPGQAWYGNLLDESTGYVSGRVEDSGKLLICMFILASALHQREKVLIFTQSLDMLDLLENVLHSYFDLSKNNGYFRLDGSTNAEQRFESISKFNDEESSARVFLISTKAGCLGVNLVGASRVIVYDASWNPSNDLQAIYRAYRFGQTRSVMIYRLIAHGTMEEKIYRRQLMKNGMSLRVVDKHEVDRLFSKESVEDLWRLEECGEDVEEREAVAALATVQQQIVRQTPNGGVLIDLPDSDDDEAKGEPSEEKKMDVKPETSIITSFAQTAPAASSQVLVLDPAHPITDAVLCQVLSLLGPKKLRAHFVEQFQFHARQQARGKFLRQQVEEAQARLKVEAKKGGKTASPPDSKRPQASITSSAKTSSSVKKPTVATKKEPLTKKQSIEAALGFDENDHTDDVGMSDVEEKSEVKKETKTIPNTRRMRSRSGQSLKDSDTEDVDEEDDEGEAQFDPTAKKPTTVKKEEVKEEKKEEKKSAASKASTKSAAAATKRRSKFKLESDDDAAASSSSSGYSNADESSSSESSDDSYPESSSEESEESDYDSPTPRRRKRRSGRGHMSSHEKTHGTKLKAHYLAQIELPVETGVGQELKRYIQHVMTQDPLTFEPTPSASKPTKSTSSASAAAATPSSEAANVAPPAILVQRSWVASIQQPDALLTAMPDLALTETQQKEAEDEFARALTDERLFDQRRPQQISRPNSFVPFNMPIIFPPKGMELLAPQVYQSIQSHYLAQLRIGHSDFLNRVMMDMMRHDYSSQAHLQQHFETFVDMTLRQQGIDLHQLQAQAMAVAAANSMGVPIMDGHPPPGVIMYQQPQPFMMAPTPIPMDVIPSVSMDEPASVAAAANETKPEPSSSSSNSDLLRTDSKPPPTLRATRSRSSTAAAASPSLSPESSPTRATRSSRRIKEEEERKSSQVEEDEDELPPLVPL